MIYNADDAKIVIGRFSLKAGEALPEKAEFTEGEQAGIDTLLKRGLLKKKVKKEKPSVSTKKKEVSTVEDKTPEPIVEPTPELKVEEPKTEPKVETENTEDTDNTKKRSTRKKKKKKTDNE